MPKRTITTEKDFEEFFEAFNNKEWDKVLSYLSDDCVWDASEERREGLTAIKEYWTKHHSCISETLGRPQNVVFGIKKAYLQVMVKMEFLEDGAYFGKDYTKGSTVEFWCADAYTFADDGTIKECRVYTKF